jgi:hypothetical protein
MERFAGETINLLTFMGTRGYANEIGAMSAEERRAVGENGYDNGIGAMSAEERRARKAKISETLKAQYRPGGDPT